MKKILLLFITISIGHGAFSQDKEEKNLTIFKFNPLQLATSSLSFSIEKFNQEKSRSSNFTFGVRYRDDDRNNYGSYSPNGTTLDTYDKWKGLTGIYERRIYVPRFKDGRPNFINTESSQNGIYLAPSLRIDYTNRDFKNGGFEYVYDDMGKIISETVNYDSGVATYVGIMPSINLGVQFSIFQYGYIDLFVGGGLRIQSENIKNQVSDNRYSYYNSNIITELVLSQGVRPNGGISFGVRI
jgi:hypothetical protein